MTNEDIRRHMGEAISLLTQLHTALQMAEFYATQGDADAAEGCRQTARAALCLVGEHLAAFREAVK